MKPALVVNVGGLARAALEAVRCRIVLAEGPDKAQGKKRDSFSQSLVTTLVLLYSRHAEAVRWWLANESERNIARPCIGRSREVGRLWELLCTVQVFGAGELRQCPASMNPKSCMSKCSSTRQMRWCAVRNNTRSN